MPDLGDRQMSWRLTEYPASRRPLTEEQADQQSAFPQDNSIRSKPTFADRAILSRGDDAWRYNTSWQGMDATYDVVNTKDACWSLFPDTLKIYDPGLRATKDPEQGVGHRMNSFYLDLGDHIFNGFGIGRFSKLKLATFEMIEGDRWRARLSRVVADRITFEVEFVGHWLAAEQRGRTSWMKIIGNTYTPANVGTLTTYSDYMYDSASDLDLCRRTEQRDNAGTLLRVSESPGLTDLPTGGFALATMIPNGKDPIRGDIRGVQVADYAKRTLVDGRTGTTSAFELPAPEAPADERGFYRTLGYVLLGCVLVALAVLKHYKRGSPT